jgi:hypothetical protein
MWSGMLRMSVVATLALSCASGNKYKPEPMPPRVQDGAPDKLAAQRAAAPHQLQLEAEHERWGYEAAQQVKDVEQENKAAKAKKAAPPPPPPAKAVGVTGPPGASSQPAAPTPPGATPQPPPAVAPAPGN